MPRYIIHVDLFVRPAQEDEAPVIIEISEDRAAPLLAQGFISVANTNQPEMPEDSIADVSIPPAADKPKSSARRTKKFGDKK